MRRALILGAVCCCTICVPAHAQTHGVASLPDSARLVTSDVVTFWKVYDSAQDEQQLARLLQTEYLDSGTTALRDFIPARILGADSLAAFISRRRDRYEAARVSSLSVTDRERAIRAPWYALEYLYPEAVYPDVFFVIGRFNSGGTVSPAGSIIGAEMLPPPDEQPWLIAHELIHFQQPSVPKGRGSLLAQSIREGAADFIAELISGRPPSAPYMDYGRQHERELWTEFQQVMLGANYAPWIYAGARDGRPADLGYFIGYRIVEAYFTRAADRRRAIREIINTTEYESFLRTSGYSGGVAR